MNTAQRLDDLAISVCQTIRDLRKEHQAWISIDSLHDRMGLENLRTVDAAVAFARAKGWLAIGGVPAHSVLLKQGAP
jgi:D-serine deaminase-like pyridoxal phosphate-dependent protein